jgi:hypothetical protein
MRVRMAACFLALSFTVLATHDASAAPRGFTGTRAFVGHPVARAGALRPIAGSLRHAGNAFFARRGLHFRNRAFGTGLWGTLPWYNDYNGRTDYPADRIAPYSEPLPLTSDPRYNPFGGEAPVRDSAVYIIPYRPGCDSQTERLPWRNGSERTIRIVRC